MVDCRMRDWPSSGKTKIDRAYEHIEYFEAEVESFRERRPFQLTPERYVNGNFGTTFTVHVRENIPIIWGAVVADAIHNLRVALDYMWQLAVYGSKQRKGDQFPSFPNPKAAKVRFDGKEKGRIKAAVETLKSVDAFRVENPFWDIRCFDDADKHDTMALVAHFLTGFRVDTSLAEEWSFIPGPSGKKGVIEEGAILYAVPPITKVQVSPEATFEIAFGESKVLKGEPIIPTLEDFADDVTDLAEAFEEDGLFR